MKKVSLAVMRLQPLHNGHKLLIETMIDTSDTVIVAIGSTQEARSEKNPFTYEERVEMIQKVFPKNKILTLPLIDIGATKKSQWVEYVLEEIKKSLHIKPTDYYTGSYEDSYWFNETLPINIVCRKTKGEGISATEIRRKLKERESLSAIIPSEVEEYIKDINLWA